METERKNPTLIDTFKKRWRDIQDDVNLKKVEKYFEGCDYLDIPEAYHQKLIILLVMYYLKNNNTSKERKDKEIKKDIQVIQAFLDLLRKNLVTVFRPLMAQPTIDFCNQLKNDLETKTFELNAKYTKVDSTKKPIKKFFDNLPKKFKPKALDIKYFIDNL